MSTLWNGTISVAMWTPGYIVDAARAQKAVDFVNLPPHVTLKLVTGYHLADASIDTKHDNLSWLYPVNKLRNIGEFQQVYSPAHLKLPRHHPVYEWLQFIISVL